MTCNELLQQLKAFTEETTRELILPAREQSDDTAPEFRPVTVYLMRLPDGSSTTKKAPYVLHQLLTRKDQQPSGEQVKASATVRTIFCVYCKDEQEGGLMLLNLMERLRIGLLKKIVLDRRFQLDLEVGLEYLIYPDDTAPYFVGEMSSTWKLPAVRREVDFSNEQFQG